MLEENENVFGWKIPLYKIFTDDEDIALATKIIKRGNNWALGPEILELEKIIAEYIGCEYCVTFNSGTSSLHATLLAYDIRKNHEVIVPSFSFVATANSVVFVGATPVFADIEKENLGLDSSSIKKKISKNTKAILPMDYGGLSCKISDIHNIADDKKLILIEDAAEALGSTINGKKTGTISDSAIFSFCANKVMTTGEGGAVVTHSKEIYERLKLTRSHGRLGDNNYFSDPNQPNYFTVGYNWRLSSLTAGIGITQMQKLDKLIKMRGDNASYLKQRLSKHYQITFPNIPDGYSHSYQMFSILLPSNKIRENLRNFLITKKIMCKVYFEPIHLTKFYQKFNQEKIILPVTEDISSRILTLPIYPNMTNDEKNYLIESIDEFFEI